MLKLFKKLCLGYEIDIFGKVYKINRIVSVFTFNPTFCLSIFLLEFYILCKTENVLVFNSFKQPQVQFSSLE